MNKAILSWSGGKDSMLALHELKAANDVEINALLTTYNTDYGRVFMHGIRIEMLRTQAESLGIPLIEVGLSKDHTSADYEQDMKDALLPMKKDGITSVAFGDIFLEDLRQYRTERLAQIGMDAIFPLWKRNTKDLAKRFIELGYKAIVTCVDGNELGEEYVGCEYDKDFLQNLPASIDPCGEYGEFHTFAYDGPMFKKRISFSIGEKVLRDNRYWFCELEP
jgi:uncharacterized protein (TIGR00290 family)